jgi:hypothetical protein
MIFETIVAVTFVAVTFVAVTFIALCSSLTVRPGPFLFFSSILALLVEAYIFGLNILFLGVIIRLSISITLAIWGCYAAKKAVDER